MPLPLSRERTYAPLSQLVADDVNAIQDAIIALHSAIFGVKTKVFPAGECFEGLLGTGFDQTGTGGITLNATGDEAFLSLPLDVGQRIVAIRVRVADSDAGANLRAELVSKTDASLTTLDTVDSAGSGGAQTISMSPDEVLAAGTAYMVRLTTTAAGSVVVHRIEVDYDRPFP